MVTTVYGGVIDTVRFDRDRLLVDPIRLTVFYAGLESINMAGFPALPVKSIHYYSRTGAEPESLLSRTITSDTIHLDFCPAIGSDDIPTSTLPITAGQPEPFSAEGPLYPAIAWRLDESFLESYAVRTLSLSPIQYLDQQTRVLHTAIEIVSNGTGDLWPGLPPVSTDGAKDNEPVRAVSPTSATPLGYELVIITSPEMSPSFEGLLQLKRSTGFSAAIAMTDSIYCRYSGIDQAEALRNYLTDFYDNGGHYVILGGDEHQVPVRYVYFYNTSGQPALSDLIISDLYFSDLDGEWDFDRDGVWGEPTEDHPDIAPELIVGRLPFSTAEQVQTYVDKLSTYLFDPGHGEKSFLTRTAFFSSDQMRDYFEGGQQYKVAEQFPGHFGVECERLAEAPNGYAPNPLGPSADESVAGLDDGYGLINVLAHGRSDGFVVNSSEYNLNPKQYLLSEPGNGVRAFDELAAGGKAAFYYSIACSQASLDHELLYGLQQMTAVEALLSVEDGGAVGMIAFTRWGWVGSSYKLMASFYRHLFTDAGGNPARAMHLSWLDYPYYRDQIYGQNYFGDPSLILYTSAPQTYAVDAPNHYQPGQELLLTVNNGGNPAGGAEVIIFHGADDRRTVLAGSDGTVLFTVPDEWQQDIIMTVYSPGNVSARKTIYSSLIADVEDDDPMLPVAFTLDQNYPNPLNPATTIGFTLPKSSRVTLEIFNILGQMVDRPLNAVLPAGRHEIIWNGSDQADRPLPSGIYLYRLGSDFGEQTRKMVLVK